MKTAAGERTLLAAIDQGTTSSRVILFDKTSIVYQHQQEFESRYPSPGWVEQDPMAILRSVVECINRCFDYEFDPHQSRVSSSKSGKSSKSPGRVAGFGITNQRETLVVWDRQTGKPLHNALVWMDTRTQSTVKQLIEKTRKEPVTNSPVGADHLRELCGLPISTYFSALKLRWLLDNVPAVKSALDDGKLMVGTVDTWLLWNLTAGSVYATDVTNASRTMLMDINTLQWSEKLAS